MQIGELFIALGFDVDDQKLDGFTTKLNNGLKGMLAISAAAAGTVFAINKFVAGSVDAAVGMRNFNRETGDSIQLLQKWQNAAILTNPELSKEQVTGYVRAISDQIGAIRMGGGNAGAFSMLGVGMGEIMSGDAFQVLESIRRNWDDTVGKFGLEGAVNKLKETGLDPSMLGALELTNDEFERMSENLVMSSADIAKLARLGDAYSKFGLQFAHMKDKISASMAPAITNALNGVMPAMKDIGENYKAVFVPMIEFLDKNEDLKMSLIAGAGAIAIAIASAFAPVTTVFATLLFTINEVGLALRGLETNTGKTLKKLLGMPEEQLFFESIGKLFNTGSIFPTHNAPAPAYSDFARIQADKLYPERSRHAQIQRMVGNVNNNMNNVFNIQSNEDGLTLSEMIARRVQQKEFEQTQDQLENGALR